MKIFLTNVPSFYKINLYNEINKKQKIIVIFSAGKDFNDRNEDFYSGKIEFEYYVFTGKNKQKKIRDLLKSVEYEEIIISGWDSIDYWYTILISPKKKNCIALESSVFESKVNGIKSIAKRLFLSRISKAYVSGIPHKMLMEQLGFKGEIKLTGGVGLMNIQQQPAFELRQRINRFLYVGRLVEVKNLKLLIEAFNEMPDLSLNIVGFGLQEAELKSIAKENVHFVGEIDNRNLGAWYQGSDVFVLPSKSEPWGLVVEEALNNGCPVIVSDRVGCKEDLVTEKTGLIFKNDSKDDLKSVVRKMTDTAFYNQLRKNISGLDFNLRAEKQVEVYL